MPQYSINSNLTREAEHFYIGSSEIPGVQSIDFNYTLGLEKVKNIGKNNNIFLPSGPQQGSVSVSLASITSDQFYQLTGNYGVNGYLIEDKSNLANNFSFTSGYLNSYSCNCSIGQIPQIAAQFQTFGNIGRISTTENNDVISDFANIPGSSSNLLLKIADPGSLNVSIGDLNTNRLQSFNLGLSVPRVAVYSYGNAYPIAVMINYPIEIDLSLTIDKNDYVAQNIRKFPFNDRNDTISLSFNDLQTKQNILNYSFGSMKLIGEAMRTDINGSVSTTLKYKGYILKS